MRELLAVGTLILLCGASGVQAQAPAPPAGSAEQVVPASPEGEAPLPYAPPTAPYAQPLVPQPVPPPGYGQPRLQDPRQLAAISAELAVVDAQLAELQHARAQHGIAGPITMMAAGYGLGGLFGLVGLIQWSSAEEIESGDILAYDGVDYESNYDLNNDGVVDERDEHRARRGARIMGGLSLIGVGVGVAGTILLVRRLAKRRELKPDVERLRGRRLELFRALQYGGGFSQNGLQLTLGGVF